MKSGRAIRVAVVGTLLAGCAGPEPAAVGLPLEPADNPPAHQSRRPNLLILLADDMRWDAVGFAGNETVLTPHLDALARDGITFSSAYVTTPVCAISRASILTGQYARRHGVVDFDRDLPPAAVAQSYPVLLRGAGYRSGFIGKYGIGRRPPAEEFDYWRAFADQGRYEQVDSAGRRMHLTRLIAQQAAEFLQTQPVDRPFVLSVSFKAPHVQDGDPRQFIPDAADAALYADAEIPPPATADDRFWQAHPAFFRQDNEGRERWRSLFSTPELFQQSARGYYALVTGLDRAIGDIRRTLRKQGLDRNTVIVFSSDNGFYMGELGLSHKWYGHEPSVRVPLVIYDPRRSGAGRREEALALNIDLAPTLLDLAGEPIPARMQGRSLRPILRGESIADWRGDFLFEHLFQHSRIRRSAGVIGGPTKYLRYLDPDPDYEFLYDLRDDPGETANLADEPGRQEELARLRRRYDALLAEAR